MRRSAHLAPTLRPCCTVGGTVHAHVIAPRRRVVERIVRKIIPQVRAPVHTSAPASAGTAGEGSVASKPATLSRWARVVAWFRKLLGV